jgi:hypothetical protein
MRQLATIQRIVGLNPIPNADNIVCATVQGWELVVKKDEFQVGDLCVYIEIDSITPDRPEFEFLRERKFRVRTIKLRKQISQGLALPLSILPKRKYKEGDDVTELLGIVKYDPEGEKERKLLEQKLNKSKNIFHKLFSQYKWYRNLIKRFTKRKANNFPSFISKTDEVRIQNKPNLCETLKGKRLVKTEKLDGQSATYFLKKNKRGKFEFGVCSRNIHLLHKNNSSYWTIAEQLHIEDILRKLIGDNDLIVLQGEIIGEGIQGNKYEIKGYDFYAYNLKYGNKRLGSEEASNILKTYNIKFVPILDNIFYIKDTVKEMVDDSKGKSVLVNKLKEGHVIRSYDGDLSFKVINPDFLLKNDN